MIPKDVAQSARMWEAIPIAAKTQSVFRRTFRDQILAIRASARAMNGRTRNECVQLRWSRR